MPEPIKTRHFDARTDEFWDHGVGAINWRKVQADDGQTCDALLIILPCEHPHMLYVDHNQQNWSAPGPRRGWDGNREEPTFSPSILCRSGNWHGYLVRGWLQDTPEARD